jgi:hypothetical protein
MEDMLLGLATALDPSGSTGGASASGSKSREETDPQESPSVEKVVEQTGTGDETSTTDDFEVAFQTRLKAAMERLHMSDTQVSRWLISLISWRDLTPNTVVL